MRWLAGLLGLFVLAGCAAPDATHAGSPAVPPAKPAAVYIPAIGATSTLVSLGLQSNGELAVPDVSTPLQAGYWTGSAHPGQPGRPLVVVGHINGGGRPGIFQRLGDLEPGHMIVVSDEAGVTHRYVVYRKQQVDKDAFPTLDVYGETTRPELRAVTCSGLFVGGDQGFADNTIVFAALT